ncbi:VWA domain-containing protein [Salinimicrobium catena]|uniref:VWA domain-containing protein n=1 Tax=Salinimicrobium catena TaxID=390640 RepID=UPI002FE4BAED
MPLTTVLLIALAFLTALALAAFQYFYKAKGSRLQNTIFAALRFITYFSVFLLLINPKIRKTDYYTEKPRLILAVDNSASISHFEKAGEVRNFVDDLNNDPELQERFDLNVYGFGKELEQASEFDFSGDQSNISGALKELEPLTEGSTAPTILITDGNQTYGEDLLYSAGRYGQPLYPVAVGDTTSYRDLAVSRVNVNRYAFKNNRFPVEIMVTYAGEVDINTAVEITSGQNTVFTKSLKLRKSENSAVVTAELPASSVGVHTYSVNLKPFSGEKNIQNNQQAFAIEVIDERSSILLLYGTLHPDLGAIKKTIEANEQREVILKNASDGIDDLEKYQLVILYQRENRLIPTMDQLQEKKKNHWIITGPKTNWRSLNERQELFRQEITGQTEEFLPVFNPNFSLFQVEDIGFSKMPPLLGSFGSLSSEDNNEILLFKEVQGVETTEPLLAISEDKEFKRAFLFGADIWKWRSASYLENGNFETFDSFFGKIVQFLSSGSRKERLTVNYENLYQGTEKLLISARYFDRNYVFDSEAKLNLRLKPESGEVREIPFLLRNNNYEVDLGNLPPGQYDFTVKVAGEDLSRSGSFRLLSFDVEEQFSGANTENLKAVAAKKDQQLHFLDKPEVLKEQLLSSKTYLPVQKSRENNVPLIDWYYLLGIIILALSGEWFLRKYYGYI